MKHIGHNDLVRKIVGVKPEYIGGDATKQNPRKFAYTLDGVHFGKAYLVTDTDTRRTTVITIFGGQKSEHIYTCDNLGRTFI